MIKQKNINIFFKKTSKKSIILLICSLLFFISIFFLSANSAHALNLPTGTGRINSQDGAIIRKLPSKSSAQISWANDNALLKIKDIVFSTKKKSNKKHSWYHVSINKKTGYVRADLIDSLSFTPILTTTTDNVNYRIGAGANMKKMGMLEKGALIKITLAAHSKNSPILWYRIRKQHKTCYVSSKYVNYNTPSNLVGKSDCAKSLLYTATSGGKARVVYSFDKTNCFKKIATKSIKNDSYSHVPQAVAFTGNNYYILYAMNGQYQYIVKYDKNGNNRQEFHRNKKGHLNGMTWNKAKHQLVITQGMQYKIITFNLQSQVFNSASTKPHSNSGVGYDKKKKYMIFSSKTAINTYLKDGKYTYTDEFERCSRSGTNYVQDCCAQNGFVFHCVSVGDKTKDNNYIDVYRTIDGKYMGSIQVKLGEIESAIVNNEGYLEILVNTSGWTDYIWTTPLKISDLKG